eukprot:TRINITY_DN17193_c1_g1_i1.p1 TRINITY_DN17193_c1_g1~~TRINITY_DN17193_c1_g1_i1.p1  ORF type:complete len:141 (+),score=38.49 TRINITY_DN17193_c1_g1_i1:189-611(+)
MKILCENEGGLLNAEVLNILKEKGADSLDVLQTGERPTSEKDIYQYLCKYCPAELNPEQQVKLIKEMKGYGLQQKEVVQLLNFVPTQEVEMYLKVEDCESRLGEDKITEVFTKLKDSLLVDEKNVEETEESVEEMQTEGD